MTPVYNVSDYILKRKDQDRYVGLSGFHAPLVERDNAAVFSGWTLRNTGYNWRQWYIAIDVTNE